MNEKQTKSIVASELKTSELIEQACRLRYEIFVEEQKVPAEIERDKEDETACHVGVISNGEVIATGRLVIRGNEGQIGRMAVQKAWRGKGLGEKVLLKLIEIGKAKGLKKIILHAQIQVIDFYSKFGFVPVGEFFEEAGIIHRKMERT